MSGVLIIAAALQALGTPQPVSPDAGQTGPATPPSAQTGSDGAPQPPTEGEIIVTATRRSESLQRVPLAISAIGGDELAAAGVVESRALPQLAPSLFISTSNSESAGAQIRLRGVGTSSNNTGFEGSVGIYADGVYLNRPGEALSDLLDVKRIEVLRGPQGTLYGKNTTTGVINLISNEPTFDWHSDFFASYGNFNAMRAGATVSGPLAGDTVAFRIAGQLSERDGYLHDVLRNRDLNDRNRYQLRGQLLFQLGDAFRLRLIGEMQYKQEACCGTSYLSLGAGATIVQSLGGTIVDPQTPYVTALDGAFSSYVKSRALTAIADLDLGSTHAKVIYGHRYFRSNDNYDNDQSPLALVQVNGQALVDDTDSLELQLTRTAGPIDLLFGAYAYDSRISATQSTVFGADAGRYYNVLSGGLVSPALYPAGGGDTLQTFAQKDRGLSFFTHNIVTLADGLKATLGLRWTTQDKQGSGLLYTDGVAGSYLGPVPARCRPPVPTVARALCPTNPIGGEFSDSRVTYALGLSYEPARGTLLFLNHSTGYKAGGINAARDARGSVTVNPAMVDGTFASETVKSYEAGIKTRIAFATLNVTAFWMDFDNFQIQTRDNLTLSTSVQSAASVTSKGVEVELTARPARGLTIGGSASYVLAKYGDDTPDATLRGQRLGNSPKWTLQPSVTYRRPISDWTAILNANARYVSGYIANVTLLPGNYQPGFATANASLTFEKADRLSVAFFVNNLTNKYYASLRLQASLQANTFVAFPAEPRTYGITLRKSF